MDTLQTILTVLAYGVSFIILILKNVLVLVDLAQTYYPNATRYCFVLIGIYLMYRLSLRVIRMWINFFKYLVKVSMFIGLVIFCFILYLRGARFFLQDIPFWTSYLFEQKYKFTSDAFHDFASDPSDFLDSAMRWGYSAYNNGGFRIPFGISDIFNFMGPKTGHFKVNLGDNQYGFEVNEEAFEHIRDSFDPDQVKDFVSGGLNQVDDLLKGNGIDMNDIFHKYMNN